MTRKVPRFVKRRNAIWAYVRHPRQVTCLDCGFLACSNDDEVVSAERARLYIHEKVVRCFRSLWIVQDLPLDLRAPRFTLWPDFNVIYEELERPRRRCRGFYPYDPGRSPSKHLDLVQRTAEKRLRFWLILVGAVLVGLITLCRDLVNEMTGPR